LYDQVGVYTVEVRLTDASGNYTDVTITVTVEDTTPPEFIDVPTEAVEVEYSDDFDLNSIGLGAIDNAQGNVSSFITTDVNIAELGLGEHEVEYTVTDQFGNVSTKTIIINIKDTTPPKILDIRPISVVRGSTFDIRDYIEVTDNFDLDLLDDVQFKDDVILSRVGTYETILTVSDSSGNTYEHAVTITVLPNYQPYYYVAGLISVLSLAAVVVKFKGIV